MMPQVTGRGTRLYYEGTGAGPVMLLSHSWWCDGRQWPQVPVLVVALADTGHLAALEQPDAFGAALLRFAAALPPPAA